MYHQFDRRPEPTSYCVTDHSPMILIIAVPSAAVPHSLDHACVRTYHRYRTIHESDENYVSLLCFEQFDTRPQVSATFTGRELAVDLRVSHV